MQLDENGEAKSFGVFQQKPAYWPTAHGTVSEQTRAFIAAFLSQNHTGDPVPDCWRVQRWAVPGSAWPNPGPNFLAARETQNYTGRVSRISQIIAAKLP